MADGVCNKCGAPIDFRFVDGVCTPIHRGGSCASADDWSVRPSGPSLKGNIERWEYRDFCVPSRCPECRAEVFFVRHNGGSVWFDQLGWPWPKHACCANQDSQLAVDWALERASAFGGQGLFGVVVRKLVFAEREYRAKLIALSLSNQSGVCVRVDPKAPLKCGDLVSVEGVDNERAILVADSGSYHDAKLADPSLLRLGLNFLKTGSTSREQAEIERRGLTSPPAPKPRTDLADCPRCGVPVKKSRLARHLAKVHGTVNSDS